MSTGDVYRGDLSDISTKDLRDAVGAIGNDRGGIKANASSKIPLVGGEHLYVNGEGYRIKKGKTIFGTEHMQLCKDDPAGTVLVNVPYDIDTTDDEAISAIQRELSGEVMERVDVATKEENPGPTYEQISGGVDAIFEWVEAFAELWDYWKEESMREEFPPPDPSQCVIPVPMQQDPPE